METLYGMPAGAVIVSAITGESLASTGSGWVRTEITDLVALIPVAHDIFAEAAKTVAPAPHG